MPIPNGITMGAPAKAVAWENICFCRKDQSQPPYSVGQSGAIQPLSKSALCQRVPSSRAIPKPKDADFTRSGVRFALRNALTSSSNAAVLVGVGTGPPIRNLVEFLETLNLGNLSRNCQCRLTLLGCLQPWLSVLEEETVCAEDIFQKQIVEEGTTTTSRLGNGRKAKREAR